MHPLLRLAALCAFFVTVGAQAQFGGMAPTGVNAAFIKLFGSHTNFSAMADVQVLDKEGKDWARMPIKVAALDQKMRLEIDMFEVKSRDLPEFALSSLKKAGMNEVVSIVRPDKKATFLMYPGAQSYLNLPLTPEDAKALQRGYKTQITSLGKETLSGKERTKNKVLVKDFAGGTALEATTWLAPELKNFPIQVETRQDNMTVVMRFSNVQFGRPAASRFEVPAGYTEYTDMQKMMFAVMKRIAMGSSQPAK